MYTLYARGFDSAEFALRLTVSRGDRGGRIGSASHALCFGEIVEVPGAGSEVALRSMSSEFEREAEGAVGCVHQHTQRVGLGRWRCALEARLRADRMEMASRSSVALGA